MDTSDQSDALPVNLTAGMPQIDYLTGPDVNGSWSTAIQLLPYLSIVGNQSTLGLANPTLYDILDPNDGVGNTTVNATTAEVECFNVPNTTATSSNVLGEEYYWKANAIYDNYDMTFFFWGILDSGRVIHDTWFDPNLHTGLPLGRNAVFLTTFDVVDSQGNAGSYVSGYNYTNLQVIGCTLSWTPTKAIVDTGSRYVLAIEPGRAINRSSAWSEWKPGLQNSTDQREDLQADVWASMLDDPINGAYYNGYALPNANGEPLPTSQIDEYIMTALGQPLGGNVTLTQFENTLSDLSASVFWASVHLLPSGQPGNDTSIVRGSTVVAQTVSRLNINPIPLFFGFVASVLLLVLAIFLTYGATKASYMLDGMGPLHVIWLTAEHADLRKRIASVGEPATSDLRRAGMLETISLDHGASNVTLVDVEYTRVDGKDNE
ncbi:uncharacterized protein LAESUDRAFT_760573 [Laetiporus sulphureus 93-53]|uniref:Uncharacterized protein n=1 Tax=Laetiporus sulphureus 93-53 TaxID=1314785 RepID=A0A165DL59_9APHY|nr:uncharacterized protein LAESUDRAFT_760573 [Laetiporus sulphureus 93-53]KZT05125.1 hypothetical protein LAESUDRAFT_760573 [Laetiporus sulphureus 93-53]